MQQRIKYEGKISFLRKSLQSRQAVQIEFNAAGDQHMHFFGIGTSWKFRVPSQVDAMDCSERNLVLARSFPLIEGPQFAEVDDVFFGAAQAKRRYSAAYLTVVGGNICMRTWISWTWSFSSRARGPNTPYPPAGLSSRIFIIVRDHSHPHPHPHQIIDNFYMENT